MREQKESKREKNSKKTKKRKKFLSFVLLTFFKNASGSTAPYKNHKRFAEEESDDDF